MARLPWPPPSTAAPPCSTFPPILVSAIFSTPPKLSAFNCNAACAPAYFHCGVGGVRSSNGAATLNPVPLFLSNGQGSGGFPVASASPRRRRGGKSAPAVAEVEDLDEDYDEWEDEDGEEEGDGDGPAVPFGEMRRWLRNKPAGFGEGKSYNTAIEDRLLEEMEQSRKAQLANDNKLKSGGAGQTAPAKEDPRARGSEAADIAPYGACVRVRGLPRKKNIHKDLKMAFKSFPSIVNISPAVVGNKKTRDPVCKGFAFIDFDSDEAANRFVQTYSRQSVSFGRVQKEITCDIISTIRSSNTALEEQQLGSFQEEASTEPNLNFSSQDFEEKEVEVLNEIAVDFCTEEKYKRNMAGDQPFSRPVGATMGIEYSHERFLASEESSGIGNVEEAAESGSSKQKQKVQMISRKKSPKKKPDKASKLTVPGSVARLKVKERAVLTGVLSKYGEQAVPAFSEKS